MLINGKTPDEIKAAIRECENRKYCDDCPYCDVVECGEAIEKDALALIERLEAERDYLLNELVGRTCYPCRYCKHLELRVDEEPCNSCLRNPATTFGAIGAQCFEWRGVPKESE